MNDDFVCRVCMWWAEEKYMSSGKGQCRGNPPVVSPGFGSLWPETYGGDWCGKFFPGQTKEEGEEK